MSAEPDLPGPSTRSKDRKDKGQKRESLKSVMSRKKKEMQEHPEPGPSSSEGLTDPYASSTASNFITRGPTGIVYDAEVLKHRCEWDPNHPEKPERLSAIMERCEECGLIEHCVEIENPIRKDLFKRIVAKHTVDHYYKLQKLSMCNNLGLLEAEAATYDSVYFNQFTFDSACLSLSSVLNLVMAVVNHDVMNGMAFVRPPGHHAMCDDYNGYCFFNNVAVAAEACITDGLVSRIMIVDIDVHHGQGTQRMFYERKDVLYFSIHRYEHGCFWPNLLESNFNYVGQGDGTGYNVNVPLNATGLTDDDYLAIVLNLLLPIGYEFNPELIILSAGYDAAIGCPEGQMCVTPGFYAHLTSLLHTLARGKLAVVLEGGYFIPSLAEGATMTLKALLGGPCPSLAPLKHVHPTVKETIKNVKRQLSGRWKCFDICEFVTPADVFEDQNLHKICYHGQREKPPYQTRNCYPVNSDIDDNYHSKLTEALVEKYSAAVKQQVLYVYDESMLLHTPQLGDVERPERPERLTSIIKVFNDFGLNNRLLRIPIAQRNFEYYTPHAPHYFEAIGLGMGQSKDVYVNEHTQNSIVVAVSGVLSLVDAIMMGTGRSGIAVIRPPGHHAQYEHPQGFCFVNNIAVAAKYMRTKYNIKRILIVDFDIHHGNGTQNMFYTDPHVMFISIHRHDDGKFFPPKSPRNYTNDGHGDGRGYNINIPFNKDKMGDTEYISTFHNIVLPAAYAFAPEFVIVSGGFDAGIHDPLGGYAVNPETFGHMITMLKPLAEGKLIISLEGGYNLTTTSYAMGICAKALLGDPIIMPKILYDNFSTEAKKTINNVIEHFKQYYDIFCVHTKLPNIAVVIRRIKNYTEKMYTRDMTRTLDPNRIDDNEYVETEMRALNSSNY